MHTYDQNGSIREYKARRVRRDNFRAILFGIGFGCLLVLTTCAVVVFQDFIQASH